MKIGIDARLIDQTGVGRYTRNLYKNLPKLDKLRKRYKYELMQPKIKWHSLVEQIIFPFWLFRKKYDLVHFTYFSFPIFCPKKFIITIHDLIPWHFKTGRASRLPFFLYQVKYFFYKLLLWVGARRAAKIIAVSETTKKEIINHLKIDPQKIKIIYEAVENKFKVQSSILRLRSGLMVSEVEPSKFKIMPTKSSMLDTIGTMQNSKLKNYFLYVGNAYPHKNLMNLIEAFKQLNNETMKQFKLILVGPDDYFYQKLKAWVIKKNLQDKIIFYGPANDEQLVVLYKQAIALINPSLMEGFGLPGLEAMAVGCPVICSKIEVFEEIYGRAVLYFNPMNIGDIRQKINKFLTMEEKEKKDLVNLGKVQAEKYSWKKCAKETAEVYEDCFNL